MKKQVLILAFAVLAGFSSYAQCGKKIVLTTNLTEYLNGSDELQKTVEEMTTVEYDSRSFIITPPNRTMEGIIDSVSCNWKTPYKDGKTVLKGSFVRPDGTKTAVTMTIEGKDGKITIIAQDENANRKIRLTADKFEEKK